MKLAQFSSRRCVATGQDYASPTECHRTGVISGRARRKRLLIIFVPLVVWLGVVVARLASLQLTNFERWQDWALKQHLDEFQIAGERGTILDRSGRLLAVSVPAGSVYVRPRRVQSEAARKEASEKIAGVLDIDPAIVREKFQSKSPFVWVKRQIPRATAKLVQDLKIPGAGFILESRRYYPYGSAASTLLGKVGIDGTGLSGLERIHNETLQGENIKRTIVRDALGNMIHRVSDSKEFYLPKGSSVELSLDANIQLIVDEELEAGRLKANAKSAAAVMVDVQTGEVVAMSQAPLIDFNVPGLQSGKELKNRLVETVYEPGSTFKPLVAAAAIDAGVVTLQETIDCENGSFRIGRHNISDVHPNDKLPFRDVVVRSSNIGMTKVGIRLGQERLYESLRAFGFGQKSGLNLPGESRGILRPVKSWANVDVATHSFGQGVAVTPLQMVRAISAIANGGVIPSLQLVRDGGPVEFQRILSERTANLVQEVMYAVVEDPHGTGKRARIEGVRVGGKTGTAQKARVDGRGYEAGKYVASFIGFADASGIGVKKNLALIVLMDEPDTTSIYGGVLAAPVFQRIMQRSLAYLATADTLHRGSRVTPGQDHGVFHTKGSRFSATRTVGTSL